MTKLEAVLFFIDLITIFAGNTPHSRLIPQMATRVMAPLIKHFRLKFNKINKNYMAAPISGVGQNSSPEGGGEKIRDGASRFRVLFSIFLSPRQAGERVGERGP